MKRMKMTLICGSPNNKRAQPCPPSPSERTILVALVAIRPTAKTTKTKTAIARAVMMIHREDKDSGNQSEEGMELCSN